jgi:hypothetical protein
MSYRIRKGPYKFHDDAARADFVTLQGAPFQPLHWVRRAQRQIAANGYIIKPPRDWGRAKGGRATSERKQVAARANGKLGGRPRKETQVMFVT